MLIISGTKILPAFETQARRNSQEQMVRRWVLKSLPAHACGGDARLLGSQSPQRMCPRHGQLEEWQGEQQREPVCSAARGEQDLESTFQSRHIPMDRLNRRSLEATEPRLAAIRTIRQLAEPPRTHRLCPCPLLQACCLRRPKEAMKKRLADVAAGAAAGAAHAVALALVRGRIPSLGLTCWLAIPLSYEGE